MSLKAYNNGIQAKEIRCVDAKGVERIIREIRKGDVQWWKGESDPPSIKGTWTKVADGLYQTKAVIPSYTKPNFLKDGVNTNYVIVSFHSYENTVTCEFFGDFEGVNATPSFTNGLDGEFHFTYSWTDASGTGLQSYTCKINVFPKSNGDVTACIHAPANSALTFTEDSAFVSAYGDGWVVQGTAAHNKMCSDAFDYYTDKTVYPWGLEGRYNNTWYNANSSGNSSGGVNYICSDNGRAFSVKVLDGSVSLVFCPPGGSAAGWVASKDSRFPSSSGWYQKTKKDGYTKFFNTSTGRFAEYLPKESFQSVILNTVRSSIGSNLSDSEYANRVVCTDFNAIHLETSSKVAERKTNSSAVSDYDTEYYYDVYGIPLVNLTTGAYIFGHYNPSVYVEFTIDTTSCRYTTWDGLIFNSVITMTFSNGNSTIGLELNQDMGFSPNTFLTGTYPKANYMYEFDQSNDEYASLIIACIADNESDVVGDFHEYRLPAGASYELKSISLSANGTTTSFTPANGYVLGTGYFTDKDSTFRFVIRPSSLMSTYYHRIIFSHTNVSTSSNSKALEISANLSYFGTTTYSKPQDSLAEDRKLVPVYWSVAGADPEDRINSSYDGSRYMTSSTLYCRITLTCDWDPKGETFTDNWWWAKYVLPIATSTPMTVAKATFMCDCISKYDSLPGIGRLSSLGISFSESHNASQSQIGNGVFTITMDRSTGVVIVSSTAKEKLPRVGENIYTYSRYLNDVRYLYCTGHPDGDIILDMYTGEYEWDLGSS